ncbi:MAG: V-type ATP synthase subunit A [Anaerolineae bacterium]|nr:V-type ATP synthase subunit A [Anaerolineae bacterium]
MSEDKYGSPSLASDIGHVIWINGPVIRAQGSEHVGMLELVEIGDEHLIGEVIGLNKDVFTIQVYEETTGLHPGTPVYSTGTPLSVELGPGLIGSIFDGIQRPLPVLQMRSGTFIGRGIKTTPLYHKQKWHFTPQVTAHTDVQGGTILGEVPETTVIEHRIMVPPRQSGMLSWIAPEGDYTIIEPIARIRTAQDEQAITMLQHWPVRTPRPYKERLIPDELLLTGQRVLDTFFPLAKGGTALIPGGFGAGKTMTQQAIARWSNCDIIIYIGCGERGNEITQVLQEFPSLIDPYSQRSLMERTILVANTSNMPVAAREASIYTGVTLAEYYRDMGYSVAIMADSTSRWAEALREISGRLEEMPAEEGYPAYLAARLASFYERAGRVTALNGKEGSISIIGAVSPPSNDFSEPVTQHSKRFIRCFWALDKTLAGARHFPSVNWLDSYTEYIDNVTGWWYEKDYPEWLPLRSQALEILQRENQLLQIVKLVGPDALPDNQRLILETARLLREGFLQQNALDNVDAYAAIKKQMLMLQAILHFHERAKTIIAKGCPIMMLQKLPELSELVRMKYTITNENVDQIEAINRELDAELDALAAKY